MRHLTLFVFLAACTGGAAPTPTPSEAVPAPAAEPPTADVSADSPAPAGAATEAVGPGVLDGYTGVYAGDPTLTTTDVAVWDPAELSVRRNEIYARYGRAFNSEALKAHFEAQPWYRVRDDFDSSWLTEADRANAALIKSFEGKAPDYADLGVRGELGFYSDSAAIILDEPEMGLYMATGQARQYTTRGPTRLITWQGSGTFTPGNAAVKDAELWTWDGKAWTRESIPQPQG